MNMKIAVIVSIVSLATKVSADVRDDYRACEQKFLSKLQRDIEPTASTADEEYCLGLGYWFHTNQSRLPRDPAKSAYWHTKAAEHGSRQAQVTLAYYFEKGHGVEQDLPKAVKLYHTAAAQGDASAMFNLGRLYSLGRGVPKDEAQSEKWFKLAKENGSAEAAVHFRQTAQRTLETPGHESFKQGYEAYQAKNYAAAVDLYRKAADAGNVSAMVALGQLYRQGLGVPQDLKRATDYYRQAAEKGHARGQAQLGLSYELGEGVTENWAEAISWYKKSAEQLDVVGLFSLGRAYQFGIGVTQDRITAVRWFELAANQDDAQARYFEKWLRVPGNCLGYVSDEEREKFAGICSDPKVKFDNSAQRKAWLVDAMNHVKIDSFGASSYQQGACGAMGGDFRSGNCYGHGGVIVDPFSNQDRYGNRQW